MMPWFRELASPDPALRRSDSPPLSLAGDVEMEDREMEREGIGISGYKMSTGVEEELNH